MRKHVEKINKCIEFVFYSLFITTPLAMHPTTSELFELNKMWLVYIYSIIIFFLWGIKIILAKKLEIRRTPFDIPLALFFFSQFISTIISLDQHTSFWGYYSRFNGGLMSTICYLLLFYAFATNLLTSDKEESIKKAKRMLMAVFVSGVLVALWGLPSHFGYDPTCLVFRGTLDVACWTDAFQPKVRMFSTLGQPNWLAAFLLILIPISTAYTVSAAKKIKTSNLFSINTLPFIGFFLTTLLFYYDLGWTLSQSGFLGFWIGNLVFVAIYTVMLTRKSGFNINNLLSQRTFQTLIALQIIFALTTFLTVNPIPSLNKYGLSGIKQNLAVQETIPEASKPTPTATPAPVAAQPALEAGITGSGDIRRIVWQGAVEIWKANPIIGSGVETFAFAYYKHRPAEHNLTSEWDYLYNKAHNEFLNYLATTGLFGLGSYLLFLGLFIFFAAKFFFKKFRQKLTGDPILPALVGAFVGISVSNFFGFSVVIVNMLMFLIPLFFWVITKPKSQFYVLPKGSDPEYINSDEVGTGRIMVMCGLGIAALYFIIYLVNYWSADKHYGLGYNYNRINMFQEANPSLEQAVKLRSGEDLYKNELSVNLAALAIMAAQQQDVAATNAFATRAKELSDEVARNNPNNVVYWKARTRVMYSLSELSPQLLPEAVNAIDHSYKLAPTDAKVLYNQALIYDQIGRKEEAITKINEAIRMKKNYRDAYYAKALFLSQHAESLTDDPKKASQMKEEAKEALNFTLKNILPYDQQAIDLLKTLE